jgi:outer membrane protein, heavy metal efflux system
MRKTYLSWLFGLLVAWGNFSLRADTPAQPPGDVPTMQPAQNGSAAQARPAVSGTTRRRSMGEAQRPKEAPGAQLRTQAPAIGMGNRSQVQAKGTPAEPRPATQPPPNTRLTGTRLDAPLRRVQATSSDMNASTVPNVNPLPPGAAALSELSTPPAGGQAIPLQAALYGAITNNPDLVTLRQGNALVASAESVEVARNFPTTLNPTIWIDYRPITLVPNGTFGTSSPGGSGSNKHEGFPGANGFYHYGQGLIYISLRQPVELGHQTTHRYHIAQAAFDQQKWVVVQAELTALVQTYRFFQTAAYRREKYRLAEELANFNDRLSDSLQKRMEANQVQAADVALARVESRATRQLVKAARQDYLTALTDLRNQIGIPEQAGAIEPLGEFTLPPYIPPVDEQVMIQEALQSRPDIHAAYAQVNGTHSAVSLAKGDRIPTPIIGPQYAMDEAGVQYVGFVLIGQVPIWNNGKPLVLQREAEHRRAVVAYEQARQRAAAQVRAAVAKWNGATELVNESSGLITILNKEVGTLDQLFEAGQADLTKLMQARQRLIQLQNNQLDAVWQATQAQSDLLLALGMPSLIHAMLNRAEQDAIPANSATPAPASPSRAVNPPPASPPRAVNPLPASLPPAATTTPSRPTAAARP